MRKETKAIIYGVILGVAMWTIAILIGLTTNK